MDQVELQSAYQWHCDKCSCVNFALPNKAELTDEDREEAYRMFMGLDKWQALPDNWGDFELVTIPETVTCSECGTEYTTYDERVLEDDEDDSL